jgi:hypothetical protein
LTPAGSVHRLLACALVLAAWTGVSAQAPRKIADMRLAIVGVTADVEPANPVVPRNTPAGVRVIVRSAAGDVSSSDVARFFGPDVHVEGDFTGPGLKEVAALSSAGESDPLLLKLPAVPTAGDYQLSNVRLVADGRAALDVAPARVPVQVIEQVLITSVTTRPLTLDEIKAKGIVLDRDDYLGFEFTMAVKLESRAVQLTFPAVFSKSGTLLPEFTFATPQAPTPQLDLPSLPMIVPTMLVIEAPGGGTLIPRLEDGTVADVRIPSVLVIPGNVGFLKQFFSAQLFVANGAPGGSRLTVRDLSGTIRLPAGDDATPDSADDPLSLPTIEGGTAPSTLPVAAPGPDGAPGTADDEGTLQPGQQAQAEFLLRGEREGFHTIEFDIAGVLDGLATGPATVKGFAKGGVLVRNPYFDMTFTVPSVVRRGERFTMYVTVTNKGESGPANDLSVALDQSRMSGMRIEGDGVRSIPTLLPGDARTLPFTFVSEKTGQVTATYIRFDPDAGASGEMRFTAGIGERGIALSPDTLLLPSPLDPLPPDVAEAAMRVLGQAWSISLATDATRPAGVLPIGRTQTVAKALALAEAALRVTLGQPVAASVRDLAMDFYAAPETTLNAAAIDPGFDQLLRTTDAGHAFARAVGAALEGPIQSAGSVLAYQQEWASVLASGSDRITFAATAAPIDVAVVDAAGRRTETVVPEGGLATSEVPSAVILSGASGGTEVPPYIGLITQPTGGPYTIELTGRGAGMVDLAVSLPRGDGTTARAAIAGVSVTPGGRARVVIDPARPDALALETDAGADGTFEAQQALTPATLGPDGAHLVSAAVVGSEVFSNAGPYGKHGVLLFDRVVHETQVQNTSLYTIANNTVVRVRRVLSGRLAIVELDQPEGPHVPARLALGGVADLRGALGPPVERPLDSRLVDPGAVVTGRVFTPDGAGVGGVDVYYSNSFGSSADDCANAMYGLQHEQAHVRTGPDGSFQFRWVRKDVACGVGFQLVAQDPGSGSVRKLYRVVRADGEQIVLDLALFGRGTVTGVVRDLTGQPAGGAYVAAVSDTDPQVAHSALADGEGRYTIPDVLVGPVSLRAAKAYDNGATVRQGTAAGRLASAGAVATIDIVIDTGSASVSGVVTHLGPGGAEPVAGALVLYSVSRGGQIYELAAGVLSGPDGRFSFPSVPAGPFSIDATMNTPLRERGHAGGFVAAGDAIDNVAILIETPASATVRGYVRRADNTYVAGAMVREGDRATLTDASGAFELVGLEVHATRPHGLVAETPDRRKGVATVLTPQPGVVEGVVITLSALGSAEFTVLDPFGAPLAGQEVVVLADQFGLRGACALGCGCSIATGTTNALGRVRFDNLPSGAVLTRAMRNASGFFDVANGRATIFTEGQLAAGIMRFEGFGSIAGLVLDDQGRPAVGADVAVSSRRFDNNTCTLADNQPSHFVRTDYLGRFTLPSVGVGQVSITASHPILPQKVGKAVAITRPGEALENVTLRLASTFAGELSGRILLPDGATPAGAGVEVTINGPLPDITLRTDETGAFRFAKILPAGLYTMTAVDALTGALAREVINLQVGQALAHEMRLKGRGIVRVRVVDGLDVPVVGAVVRLTETTFPSRVLEAVAAEANAGVVTFERVFEGPLAIEASDEHARGGRVSATLPGPDADIEVKVRLSVTGTIRGRFLMPDGTPIPYGVVTLKVGERVIGQTTTAGSGEVGAFEFAYVPAGPARLEATDPGSARTGVAVGTIATEGQILSIDVHAQGLGTVTGVVTAGATPQPGAQVELVSGRLRVKAVADGEGRYTIDGVPEGLVSVTASVNGAIQSGTASATLSGDGATLTLDVSVRDAGRLTGTVVPAGSAPLPPVIVTATVAGLVFSTTADENGRFEFPRLPAGYVVTLAADVVGSIDTVRLTLTLPGSTTTDVLLPLRGVGPLNVRALDSTGQPTAGTLRIDGAVDNLIGGYSISVNLGPDGTFRFPELLSGPVSVRLQSNAGTATLYGTASAVVVPYPDPEQEPLVEVRLQDSATVTGVVLRADGATPAIGADVVLKLAAGPQVPVQVQADGRFTATGLSLGAFTLSVTDPFTGGVGRRSDGTTVNGETRDLGSIVLDDTPIVVTSVDPPNGSTAVAIDRAIVVTFSDPLQSASGISVQKGTTGVSTTATLSGDGRTLTLTPPAWAGGWPDASELTVTVSASATDVYGRHPAQAFTSRFHTVDLSPPAVVSTVPAHQAIQVAGTTAIQVTFDEPLAAETDLPALVTVTASGTPVAGATVLTAPEVATFTPASPLADNTLYTVVVNGAVDASGNRQTAPFTFTFATTDGVPPVLIVESPAGEWQRNARPYFQILLTDAASGADLATATLSIDGQVAATQLAGSRLVFTPPGPDLAEGAHAAQATVRDRAGSLGVLSFPVRIDTQPPSPPQITSLTDGQVVRGTIAITATSSDATSGVSWMRFYQGPYQIGERTEPPFEISYSTSHLAEGPHEFRAQAFDVAGNATMGPWVTVNVDNDPLTLQVNEPWPGTLVRDSVTVRVTPSEAVSRIEFTMGTLTVPVTSAPYQATLDVTSVAEGPVPITVTGYPVTGDPMSTVVTVTADRTPPAAPDAARITAEPPIGGTSSVVGGAGAVEGGSTVFVTHVPSGVTVSAPAAADGRFLAAIAAQPDDLLSIVAADAIGNHSAATTIAVRTVPSLPPAEGSTTLRFDGLLADRVGAGTPALSPDGVNDAAFTLSLSIGDGITRQLSYIDLAGPSLRSTRPAVGSPLGLAADPGAPLLNAGDGSVSLSLTTEATLTLFASDAGFGFIQEGATYTVTAVFLDGSRFVGSFTIVAAADRAQVAHAVAIAATPPTVVVAPGVPGTTTLALTNIRDISGTLVPDGAKIALSAASMAAKSPMGPAIASIGGEILGGEPAANNASFRVFTIAGGTVTATYSSGAVEPAAILGPTAVVQVLAADAADNVLGEEAIGTIDINVRPSSDRAIVYPVPASLYVDHADRRSTVRIEVRDAAGNPLPDGTKVAVTVASGYVYLPSGAPIYSAGGTIIDGTPNGLYRIFTVAGGAFTATYSATSTWFDFNTGVTASAVIQVLAADASGNPVYPRYALGTATITLAAAGGAEVHLAPRSVPFVYPSVPAAVVVHQVKDARGNLVPDGANFLVTARSGPYATVNGTGVPSVGGGILGGFSSPSGVAYRAFSLAGGQFGGQYVIGDGVNPGPWPYLEPGTTAIANISLVPADPSRARLTQRAVNVTPLPIVAPTSAVGTADPPSLLADGATHSSSVTFRPTLDAYGNPLPMGSLVLGTAEGSPYATDSSGYAIGSAGGQILNGSASPTGPKYKVLTVGPEADVGVSYADQQITAAAGEINVANVSLVESLWDGTRVSSRAFGTVPVVLAGTTTASAVVSPTLLPASGDRRAVVTFSGFRDAAGEPVPDGTTVLATAQSGFSTVAGSGVPSFGGTITNGAASTAGGYYRAFTIENGQIVVEYSAAGWPITSSHFATIQLVPATPATARISQTAIAIASVRLVAGAGPHVVAGQWGPFVDGSDRRTAIVVTGLALPDGTTVGLSAADNAAGLPSAGGDILAVGAASDDGTPAANDARFRIFTVVNGEVHAVYSTAGITAAPMQARGVQIVVVPADAAGNVTASTRLASGDLWVRGVSYATAFGSASLSGATGATTHVTFNGVKDAGGNTVPDGTLVLVTTANCGTTTSAGQCDTSAGGVIVDGDESPLGPEYRVFTVRDGRVVVTLSSGGLTSGTGRVQIAPLASDGTRIGTQALTGGVFAVTYQQ